MADAIRAYSIVNPSKGVYQVKWTGLDSDDSGVPFILPGPLGGLSVQVTGTFGVGGTIVIEGSGFVSSPTYATLSDSKGTALSITAAKIEEITETPYLLRPRVTGGDGTTSLEVRLMVVLKE